MKILYIDMDGVLMDFESALRLQTSGILLEYAGRYDEIPGLFGQMVPLAGATKSFDLLFCHFDVYILSTAPWENPSAWSDKLLTVRKYFGQAHKRLILSHNKHLCHGDYLVDDRIKNGTDQFAGEYIHFLTPQFPDWNVTCEYLMENR